MHEQSGLHLLASGAKPPNPTEILQSRVTQDLIRQLTDDYDMVIIDAPPLLPVADASVLSTLADGVILVVKHGRTTRDQVAEAIARVDQVGGRLFGVVVNMIPRRSTGSYYYYYYEDTSRPAGKAGKAPKPPKTPRAAKPPRPRRRPSRRRRAKAAKPVKPAKPVKGDRRSGRAELPTSGPGATEPAEPAVPAVAAPRADEQPVES